MGTTRSPHGRFSSPVAKADYFVSPIPKHGQHRAFLHHVTPRPSDRTVARSGIFTRQRIRAFPPARPEETRSRLAHARGAAVAAKGRVHPCTQRPHRRT